LVCRVIFYDSPAGRVSYYIIINSKPCRIKNKNKYRMKKTRMKRTRTTRTMKSNNRGMKMMIRNSNKMTRMAMRKTKMKMGMGMGMRRKMESSLNRNLNKNQCPHSSQLVRNLHIEIYWRILHHWETQWTISLTPFLPMGVHYIDRSSPK